MADTRTLGNMIARITREIRRDGLTADITNSIVTAIEQVEHHRFWFNEGQATATAVAGLDTVELPIAYIEADAVWYEDTSSARWTLTPMHWSDMVEQDRTSQSEPYYYALHHNHMHLYPTPDSTYVLKIDGHHELTEISAGASANTSNAWLQEAEHLIRPLAKADLYVGRLRNPERAAEQASMAGVALRNLRKRTAQTLSTGRIKKTRF